MDSKFSWRSWKRRHRNTRCGNSGRLIKAYGDTVTVIVSRVAVTDKGRTKVDKHSNGG